MSLARRSSRLAAALRSERRTFRQGVVALGLSTAAGFAAGLTLSHITGSLERLPGLLVLIPAAVGMRGTIFGAVAARLGTSIHAGVFRTDLRRDGVLHDNAMVAIVTTCTSSVWLALLAKLAATVFGDPTISIVQLVVISVVGGVLGSIVILGLTVSLSIASFRRAWDLDAVGTPMVTALGDAVTLPTLYLASWLVRNDLVTAILAIACGLPPSVLAHAEETGPAPGSTVPHGRGGHRAPSHTPAAPWWCQTGRYSMAVPQRGVRWLHTGEVIAIDGHALP